MLADNQPLPSSVAIYPMATEVYKKKLKEHALLLDVLARLDEALSGKPADRLQ